MYLEGHFLNRIQHHNEPTEGSDATVMMIIELQVA